MYPLLLRMFANNLELYSYLVSARAMLVAIIINNMHLNVIAHRVFMISLGSL